jgi:hypothetical protein
VGQRLAAADLGPGVQHGHHDAGVEDGGLDGHDHDQLTGPAR